MMRAFLIVLFLISNLTVWGCAGKSRHRPYPSQTREAIHKAQLADKYFRAGKHSYLYFKFSDSIQQIEKAVAIETSSARKAEYLLYMGASYFYLGNIHKARQSFLLAKLINRSIIPKRSDFPLEIIRLYESAQ